MIVIVDYGMGNLGSLSNMFIKINQEAKISSSIQDIETADKLILPGVGSFDNGMRNLNDLNLIPILYKRVIIDKIPVLGVCLGMQLFTEKSEEGQLKGLGWIKGETKKFNFPQKENNLKIPHMGWNSVNFSKDNKLIKNLPADSKYYFVHSYYVVCRDRSDVLMSTFHGIEFDSALLKDNIYGVQFHPEKSHKYGIVLFKNFCNLNNDLTFDLLI